MLKLIMYKHFITIILILLCLLVSRPAEARLTLGVVTGPDEAAGEVTSVQANFLAELLAEKLDEAVVVKELSDSATLISWLDRFAMLDLALLPTNEVKANPGRFLQIGPLDKHDRFNLVARQGVDGDLPKRVAAIVRESDFTSWVAVESMAQPAKQSPEVSPLLAESVPASIDEVIASQVGLQHVPPLSQGRAWAPQEDSAYLGILPTSEPLTKKMVLGVFPDPGSLVRTSQQAEQLATYLEQVLPVSIKVREFARVEAFAEWFMRYRMVDLAVLSPAIAKANLGRDYLPVAKLFRADKPGAESAELVIMRRGQNEEMQAPLQRALLEMAQTDYGQSLMAGFEISEVLAPEDILVQSTIAGLEADPVIVTEKSSPEQAEETGKELLPQAVESIAPVEPVAPLEDVAVLPELPEDFGLVVTLPLLEMPDGGPTLPEPVAIPVEPVSPAIVEIVKVPDLPVQQPVSLQPDIPLVLTDESAVAILEDVVPVEPVVPSEVVSQELPELPEIIEPDLPLPGLKPVEIALLPVPEEPEIVVAPPIPQEAVAPQMPTEVAAPAPAAPLESEQPETAVVAEVVMPGELEAAHAAPAAPEIEPELVASEEPSAEKQQKVAEEVLAFTAAVPGLELTETEPGLDDVAGETTEAWSEAEFDAVLGEDTVAAIVAQPDIPQELRLSGVPIVRPGRIAQPKTVVDDELLVASIPQPLKNVVPPRPPDLLPEPEAEPGIVYVVPFVSVMVPDQVNSRVFDQFVDTLIQNGEALGLQFVILKGGLERVSPQWLSSRKYVTGEVYAYVEDSGCCSTDLRTKARLAYHRPNQEAPAFGFEYPVKSFFDHDRSSIDVERVKLADDIAATLAGELLKALQN